MLVLLRQSGTGVQIGDDVRVYVRITPHGPRLAIDAPRAIPVQRIDGNGNVEHRGGGPCSTSSKDG